MSILDARQILEALPSGDFEFIDLNGDVQTLPSFGLLSGSAVDRLLDGDVSAVAEAVGDDAFATLMELPQAVASKVIQAWVEAAGEQGKELSPSATTRAPGARSKGTSGRVASTRKTSR